MARRKSDTGVGNERRQVVDSIVLKYEKLFLYIQRRHDVTDLSPWFCFAVLCSSGGSCKSLLCISDRRLIFLCIISFASGDIIFLVHYPMLLPFSYKHFSPEKHTQPIIYESVP